MMTRYRWYKKKYNKKFRHFFNAGYRKRLHIKVTGRALSPLEHFCKRGFKEGRQLRVKTAIGVFDGTVDLGIFREVSKLQIHECSEKNHKAFSVGVRANLDQGISPQSYERSILPPPTHGHACQ